MHLDNNSENIYQNINSSFQSSIQPIKVNFSEDIKGPDEKISSLFSLGIEFGDPTHESNLTLNDIDFSTESNESMIDLVAMLFVIGETEMTEDRLIQSENSLATQKQNLSNEKTTESENTGTVSEEALAESKQVITMSEQSLSVAKALDRVNEVENIIISQEQTGEFFRSKILDTFLKTHFGHLYFEKCDGSYLPFSESHELIKEIDDHCRRCRPSDIEERIFEVVQKYLEREDVCEIGPDGKMKRLTPQRRKEIAKAIANEIYSCSTMYIEVKKNQTKKAEEYRTEINGYAVEQSSRFAIPLLSGFLHESETIDRTCRIVVLSNLHILNNRLIVLKLEKEVSDKQVDLIERIKEIIILKDVLKREIVKYEIDHFGIKNADKNEIDVKVDLFMHIIFLPLEKKVPKLPKNRFKKYSIGSKRTFGRFSSMKA